MPSLGLGTGLRALLAAQATLDTIGHNIANAHTPGYSRQRADRAAVLPANVRGVLIGQGVNITSVSRNVDALLGRRILSQVAVSGSLDAAYSHMAEVEAFFAEPKESAIGSLLDGFFAKLTDLSGSPGDTIIKTGAVQSGTELTARIRDLHSTLGDIDGTTSQELRANVEEVNRLAEEVSRLNLEIGELQSSGAPASDLLDQRDLALRDLAKLVDVRTHDAGNGRVRVTVSGNTLVGTADAFRMELATDGAGELAFRIEGSVGHVPVQGGVIGGLLDFQSEFAPRFMQGLDDLSRNLIREFNRAHSVGIPVRGGFERLTADYALSDADGDGAVVDELLANAGLPFDVQTGTLHLNILTEATGEVVKHKIDVDAERTTVQDFLDAVNSVPELSATLDSLGHLQISADAGTLFEFSGRLATDADAIGAFGGGHASLGTTDAEPFALADGDTLDLTVGGSSFSVAFSAGDFEAIGEATAEEIAAVVNADAGAQAAGLRAEARDGFLYLQTEGAGGTESFTVDGGSALGALGWAAFAGATISGADNAVEPQISGSYTGSGEETFSFVPVGAGTIGTTPGLAVEVYDGAGQLVASLDVGESYEPGTELAVADGISVSFGLGEISAAHGDRFVVDVTDDSDSSDVLVALGLNSFFTGTGGDDIAVRRDLALDPSLVASSATGAEGDNGAILAMMDAQTRPIDELGGLSLNLHYSQMVGEMGFEVSTTRQALEANDSLLQSLDQRQQQISGVNVDEELVDLLEFEQAFAAAAQYLQVVSELSNELLAIL